MPLEIKELTIKVNLSDEGGTGDTATNGNNQEAQQAIIEAVADKVLAILREKQER